MKVHILTRLDARPIPPESQEVRLFCKLRNELVRLPYFLQFYREMGVDRFIFVDNGSTDGTTEYLLSQRDCHVLHTTDPFRDVYVHWQNRALDLYGTDHWCLVVDADEFLVFPHCEKICLKQFCRFLDIEGSQGVYSFMLDMYSKGPFAEAQYSVGQDPLDICPYHDRDYKFVDRTFLDMMRLPNRPPPFPETEVIGGPRARIFYPEQNTEEVFPRVWPRIAGRVLTPFAQSKLWPDSRVPHMASMLFKVPLVRWGQELAYYSSTHIMTPIRLSAVTSALLHYKYFADFLDKAIIEATRGAYEGGGRQYNRYAHITARRDTGGGNIFFYEGSVKYEDSLGLIKQGLIQSCTELELHVVRCSQNRYKMRVPALSREGEKVC